MPFPALLVAQLIVDGAPTLIAALQRLKSRNVISEEEARASAISHLRSKDAAMSEYAAQLEADKLLLAAEGK